MPQWIDRLAQNAAVRKFFEGKNALTLVVSAIAALAAAAGFVAKFTDANQKAARWLSGEITFDAHHIAQGFHLAFLFSVELPLLAIAALCAILLALAAIRRVNGASSEGNIEDILTAVRQIRDQGKQPKVKAWEDIHLLYLINKDFSGVVVQKAKLKAADAPVHFWESVVTVEDEADSAKSLSAVNYRVIDLGGGINNIVYLPSENALRIKKACLFFLPPIPDGQEREFQISYEWPGMFKRLRKSSEDFAFTAITRDIMPRCRIEIYLQEGAGGKLKCTITGDRFSTESIVEKDYVDKSWKGHGFTYEVTQIPPGNLNFVLKALVERV